MVESCFLNVKDFGAIGNGVEFDTEAVKMVIQACVNAGGGTIVFPSGKYLTAPFQLFSNITLYLDAGSVILASDKIDDYFVTHTSIESDRIGLIYTRDAKNVSITGKGIIDCRGMNFMDKNQPKLGHDFIKKYTRQGESYMDFKKGVQDGPVEPFDRPGNLIQFIRCNNVTLSNITILDGPNWTIHFDDSENIVINGITLKNNQLIPNSDGIHFTTCRNMRVSDCYIESGDDCIALTCHGTPGKTTENLVVTNCILSSRSTGVRIGYGDNDLRNCIFNNLVIHSNRGIGVFQRNKGNISDVEFSNITIHTRLYTGHWWGHGEPIHVSTEYNENSSEIGTLKNIRFNNITAYSETGILVYGCEDRVIDNLSFNNIRLSISPSPLSDTYGGNFDLRPVNRPEISVFAHEEYGLYTRYTKNMSVKDFELTWNGKVPEYFQDGVCFENCESLTIDGYKGRQPQMNSKGAAIAIIDSKSVSIINSIADENTCTFLAHSNITESGLFSCNNLSKAVTTSIPEGLPFKEFGNLFPKK